MTGPEHYREAERLLAGEPRDYQTEADHLRTAQVHATLALAAAVSDLITQAALGGGA